MSFASSGGVAVRKKRAAGDTGTYMYIMSRSTGGESGWLPWAAKGGARGGGSDGGRRGRRRRGAEEGAVAFFWQGRDATVGENDNGSDSGGCDAATAGEVKAGMAGGDIF